MLVIENDWIDYEAVPVRRPAVRGGARCATRFRTESAARPVVAEPLRGLRSSASSRVGPAVLRPSAPGAPARRPMRLTARGRLVLVVLPALAAVCAALVSMTARSAEAAPAPRPPVVVVVAPGQSLWAIAQRVAPDHDPRDVVALIERANGLTDAVVQPGERLSVPVAALGR